MNIWKVIFATVVIFGSGVVTGGLLVRNAEQIRAPRGQRVIASRLIGPQSPGGLRVEFLRRIGRELDLKADQQEQVDQILKASQERTRKLMEPITPQMREELARAKQEFREVLNPEQCARFEELLKQQQRSHEQRRPKSQ